MTYLSLVLTFFFFNTSSYASEGYKILEETIVETSINLKRSDVVIDCEEDPWYGQSTLSLKYPKLKKIGHFFKLDYLRYLDNRHRCE